MLCSLDTSLFKIYISSSPGIVASIVDTSESSFPATCWDLLFNIFWLSFCSFALLFELSPSYNTFSHRANPSDVCLVEEGLVFWDLEEEEQQPGCSTGLSVFLKLYFSTANNLCIVRYIPTYLFSYSLSCHNNRFFVKYSVDPLSIV